MPDTPHDEWITGKGEVRQYIVHTRAPRFIARLVQRDDYGEFLDGEPPVDLVSSPHYRATPHLILCEVAWTDEVSEVEQARWLEVAAEAIERFDEAEQAKV